MPPDDPAPVRRPDEAGLTANEPAARSETGQALGVGTMIGPYRLLEVIGEGGFGIVYLAERREPMVQRVALKVIKPGMDSRAVIARFEQERQLLALLDHPNIAKVFDGGLSERGQPYFVMELVRGEPITDFCDRRRLGIVERLMLLRCACEAIAHAHAKGVVHRDIKPSNILVQELEGHPPEQGVVKVIDFGIAKALGGALSLPGVHTEIGTFVGTPEYMAPEQADPHFGGGPGAEIDHRADVYSMGAVLYELLTGCRPFESETLRAGGADHVRHVLTSIDPPLPSNRVRNLSEKDRSTVAGRRGSDPARLWLTLKQDLERIPMMAMRKERQRRYASAEAFRDDLSRAIDGRPIAAGVDGPVYRARKLCVRSFGRNGCAVATWALGTLVALAVALGVPASGAGVAVQEARHRLFPAEPGAGAFRHVAVVRMSERSDLSALLTREFLTGDAADIRTRRLLHARLLERLARAGVRGVVFDIYFQEPSEFDAFLGGRSDMRPHADVVFGAQDFGAQWIAKGSATRPPRVGSLSMTIDDDSTVHAALAAFRAAGAAADGEEAIGLSLSLQGLGVFMAPASTPAVRLRADGRLLMDLGSARRSAVLILPERLMPLDEPESIARAGDVVGYTPVTLPDPAEVERVSIEYDRAFGMSAAELRRAVAGRMVVIADAHAGIDTHSLPDGREYRGYVFQMQALESLIRRFHFDEVWWADALVCGLAGALALWTCRRNWGLAARGATLAAVAAVIAVWGVLLLREFSVFVHPIAPLVGMLLVPAAWFWVRAGTPASLRW